MTVTQRQYCEPSTDFAPVEVVVMHEDGTFTPICRLCAEPLTDEHVCPNR